jgi:hypothetical protein
VAQNALVLFVHGAHYTPLSDLSDAGDEMAPRVGIGGGVAFQLSGSAALRASGTVINTRYRGDALGVTDSSVTRTYGILDLQLGWPGTSSFVPYIVIGAGIIRSDFNDPSVETTSYAGGRVGFGANYVSPVGAFFLEVLGTGYRWTGVPFSSTQFDLNIHAGVAIAFKL